MSNWSQSPIENKGKETTFSDRYGKNAAKTNSCPSNIHCAADQQEAYRDTVQSDKAFSMTCHSSSKCLCTLTPMAMEMHLLSKEQALSANCTAVEREVVFCSNSQAPQFAPKAANAVASQDSRVRMNLYTDLPPAERAQPVTTCKRRIFRFWILTPGRPLAMDSLGSQQKQS